MTEDHDDYAAYYADKLWQLLPALYRFEDGRDREHDGPLRELVNRIGAQAAIVRRGIDRLWEDQSIESCDAWVIPYLADLLDTRLVPGLDPREQRVNVGKTIYYRRRKGTVSVLEELAADITGWQARVVEFFRRMGRTRHALDPPLLSPGAGTGTLQENLLRQEGLRGARTRTCCGGWADLRNAYGAAQAGTPFDEFFHNADLRAGRGGAGWYNIPRLGVFLWRLHSIPAGLGFQGSATGSPGSTPVRKAGQPPGCSLFSFDPTGREIPLFAASSRAFGDRWVPAQEWQLPTRIPPLLLRDALADLYAAPAPQAGSTVRYHSLALLSGDSLIEAAQVESDPARFFAASGASKRFLIDPARGTFLCRGPVPDDLSVVYHYGFASLIGAGEYPRTPVSAGAAAQGAAGTVSGGADALAKKLTGLTSGFVTIEDSRTYNAVSDLSVTGRTVLQGGDKSRPVIRLPDKSEWIFAGAADPDQPRPELILDGLFISGGHVVLKGDFSSVTVSGCTFDPGTLNEEGTGPALSIDQRTLSPVVLWIEGHVEQLVISRSVLGPVMERHKGLVDRVTVTDSVVQGIQTVTEVQAFRLSLGQLELARATVLGPAEVHRLFASDSILHDAVVVADCQHGCVRFSAWASGSSIPRQYECVEIEPKAPIFSSVTFGDPDYARLSANADRLIRSGDNAGGIAEGGENGSEMGAFSREQYPLKLRGLRQKYEEFMPIGLTPVIIPVD